MTEDTVTITLRARDARLIEAHLQANLDCRTFDKATEPAVIEFLDQIHAALPDTAPDTEGRL
jgi:hypothetical protein